MGVTVAMTVPVIVPMPMPMPMPMLVLVLVLVLRMAVGRAHRPIIASPPPTLRRERPGTGGVSIA